MKTFPAADRLIQELHEHPAQFFKKGRGYALLQEYFEGYPTETLIPLLEDKDVIVRRQAVFIASELGVKAKDLLDDVIKLINDTDRYVKHYVLEVIAVCSVGVESEKVFYVLRAMQDEDEIIRSSSMYLTNNASIDQLKAALKWFRANASNERIHIEGLSCLVERDMTNLELLEMVNNGNEALIRKYGALTVMRFYQNDQQLLKAIVSSEDADLRKFAKDLGVSLSTSMHNKATPIAIPAHYRPNSFLTTAYKVKFLKELVGPNVDKLKASLIKSFNKNGDIKAAYLVEAEKIDEGKKRLLCLKAPYCDQKIVLKEIAIIVKEYYGPDEYFDVIFLEPHQEIHFEGICQPFYDAQEEERRLVSNGKPGLLSLTARVSSRCVSGDPFLQAVRKKPESLSSSGWEFYSDSGQTGDPAQAQSWTLQQVIERDPTFLKWLDAPVGTALWRLKASDRWEPIATPGSPPKAQEPAKRFDDFQGIMEPPAPEAVDTADGSRHYLDLKFGRNLPVGIHIYYECLSCGGIVSSAASGEKHCRCGNITVQSGVITIKDFAKAQAFRQE